MAAAVFAAAGGLFASPQSPSGKTLLIEAEEFQLQANWQPMSESTCSGGGALKGSTSDVDALTGIEVPDSGNYNVWTRARDYATTGPGTRRYLVTVDGEPVGKQAGAHGKEGWLWEKVGARQLTSGDHVLGLRDVTDFARCDAILLTTGDLDPNTVPVHDLARYHAKPICLPGVGLEISTAMPPLARQGRHEVGRVGNDQVRVTFFETPDTEGKAVITRATEVFHNGGWAPVPVQENQEALILLYSPKSGVSTSDFFPFWSKGRKTEFQVGGKTYQAAFGKNPFSAGALDILVPRTFTEKEGGVAEIGYESASGRRVTGTWRTTPGRRDVALSVSFTANKAGEYSVGFSPFQSWAKEDVAFNLLPPLFNFQRLPSGPQMSVSSTMPHALALVEPAAPGARLPFTYSVVADPARLPFEWPSPKNSAYGFSLLNGVNKVQPTIFAPILGFADSKLQAGQAKTVSWSVLAQPGDWKDALEYTSSKVFNVTDYRHPYGTSLTDAALNIIDLIKDDDHSGWDPKLKGFYNIESKATASQASPLPVISAALLTWNEDFYVKRALPTIEYTLSRRGAHFATEVPPTTGYVDEKGTKITVPSDFYGAAYWQGLDDLLGRKNPWLGRYALENGKARYRSSYGSVPRWSEMLGLYRLDPKPELLEKIKAQADLFLKTDIYGRKTRDLGLEPFYNVSFYPYWWDLIDLYELTKEQRYVDAAEEGAFHTIAGLWSQPCTRKEPVTVNPGGNPPVPVSVEWWKGAEKYRLGFPRVAGDLPEHQVPGWLVSRVGLGFEQPCTYYGGGTPAFNNIMMSAWAPSLLRVYEYTGRDILRTYARDTLIGRFSNYPGYYIRTYSDVQTTPQYPFHGPDITSLYYHHIPAHLAFTLDFLVTEAAVRSKGQITFPWVKQQGYVWFTNRVYGHAPGAIYGDGKMWLRFDRNAVKVKSDQISYLSAFGKNRFDLVLMNEADTDVAAEISLDKTKLGIDGQAPCRAIVNGEQKIIAAPFGGRFEVPAKGLVVLSFPATGKNTPPEIPVLNTAPAQQKLAGDWGTLHAFRIRSPFGKDSLFAVLSGQPAKGSSVKLVMDGQRGDAPEMTSYPYEFTVYPWPMERDMTFHVVCKDAAGHETASAPITLKGGSTEAP